MIVKLINEYLSIIQPVVLETRDITEVRWFNDKHNETKKTAIRLGRS